MLALRTATLKTRFLLTIAPRVGNWPVICPNNFHLHSCSPAQLAAMDLKLSCMLAFTVIPGSSPVLVFQKPITMKNWSTMRWICHGAISPSKLLVPRIDMIIDIKTLQYLTSEYRGLLLLILESPRQQIGTIHTATLMVSHDKQWTNS